MVDKDLFPYDLAIVAILKNESAYLKEWLDYHLLAGVDHFYLYDNDSTDNQAEVAKPYVEAGLVDYIPAPGKMMQMAAYNDAIKNFKFHCRYMAFIDVDEFIFPKTNQSIIETVDEILSQNPEAAGLAINRQIFGSNGHETADYSHGVLERFTRRAPVDIEKNFAAKTVANPRAIDFINNPHNANYFAGLDAINENGEFVQGDFNSPVTAEKIAVNYYTKSYENYECTEVFDDGILKYRAERAQNFSLPSDDERFNRVTQTLTKILSGTPDNLETALTCRELSNHLGLKTYEEASLAAILNSLNGLTLADGYLLLRELPKLFRLPYPAVKYLREISLNVADYLTDVARRRVLWDDFVELDYLRDFLKLEVR